MPTSREVVADSIASAGTKTGAVVVPVNKVLVGIELPSALTGTSFSFEISNDQGTTYVPIYKDGTLYSVTVGTSRYVELHPDAMKGSVGGPTTSPTYIKAVSGAGGGEAESRTIKFIFARID